MKEPLKENGDADLPKTCPRCGGDFRNGYGILATQVRSFWPQSKRPIGILYRDDREVVMCRTCFNAYDLLITVMDDAAFNAFSAGRTAGIEHEKRKTEGKSA